MEFIDIYNKFKDYCEYSEDVDSNIIVFIINNNISENTLIELLNAFYNFEYTHLDTDIRLRVNLDVKKVACLLKHAFKTDNLVDPITLLNIINLIKPCNTLDDEFFKNENIFVNSIEELIDLKLEIKEDLTKFITNLSKYFIGLLKSYNKFDFIGTDDVVTIPPLYEKIILSVDIIILSGVLNLSSDFNIHDCPLIYNSQFYLDKLIGTTQISNYLFNIIQKE